MLLQSVDVSVRKLRRYHSLVSDEILDAIHELALELRGIRLLHVNATSYGGGVSELLRSLVPLQIDCGLRAEWRIISGDPDFFRVTKSMHNGLQGQDAPLDDRARAEFLHHARQNALQLEDGSYDVIIVHDPQPVPLPQFNPGAAERWIWRCHIDTSSPSPAHWKFLEPMLDNYDALVFTMREFVPPGLDHDNVRLIPPAIDPLSPKNRSLSHSLATDLLEWIGIDLDKPLLTQVSRFDPWKDPLGVVAIYRELREEHPGLQLALVGSMAFDDPESWEIYRQLHDETRRDPDIHLCTNLTGVGNIEVNAFQRLSDVVVQKSIREGFGLVVAETLWKGTPMVAAHVGGIPLQMADGTGGILVDREADFVPAISALLNDRERARTLAAAGQQRIREHFLTPRLLLSELALIRDTLEQRAPSGTIGDLAIDPQCGLPVLCDQRGACDGFCSQLCRTRDRARSAVSNTA